MSQPLKYRPEIDGLRALAVIPVILFHAGFEAFSGGFVGVDVFFVISGFLITSILIKDLEAGQFSLVRFYERRARRILPALFFVMAICIPFSWLWLVPTDFRDFSQSLTAVVFFASNILFWKETNYFDTAAELKPLLHTWSLAVEEQYYLLFPVLLFFLWKFGRRKILWVMAGLFVVSLVAAQQMATSAPSANFFLLPSRGWELLIGVFGAFAAQNPKLQFQDQKNLHNLVSILGLLAVFFSIAVFDGSTPFPSLYALIPTIGTLAIIHFARPYTLAYRFLSFSPFVKIGLASYSAYLIHQPLFAYARNLTSMELSTSVKLSLSLASLILSFFTLKFVEDPFRNKSRFSRRQIFKMSLVGSLFFLFVGVLGDANKGFPKRINEFVFKGDMGHLEFHKFVEENFYACGPDDVFAEALTWEGFTRCMQSKPANQSRTMALLGDSHAEHLFIGLAEQLTDENLVFYIRNSTPYWGNPEFEKIFAAIFSQPNLKEVLISAHWVSRITEFEDLAVLEKGLLQLIDELEAAGKKLWLVGDNPRFSFGPESCNWNRWPGIFQKCSEERSVVDEDERAYREFLKRVLGQRPAIGFLPVGQSICRDEVCSMEQRGTLLYRDRHHLNIPGSRLVGAELVEFLK